MGKEYEKGVKDSKKPMMNKNGKMKGGKGMKQMKSEGKGKWDKSVVCKGETKAECEGEKANGACTFKMKPTGPVCFSFEDMKKMKQGRAGLDADEKMAKKKAAMAKKDGKLDAKSKKKMGKKEEMAKKKQAKASKKEGKKSTKKNAKKDK